MTPIKVTEMSDTENTKPLDGTLKRMQAVSNFYKFSPISEDLYDLLVMFGRSEFSDQFGYFLQDMGNNKVVCVPVSGVPQHGLYKLVKYGPSNQIRLIRTSLVAFEVYHDFLVYDQAMFDEAMGRINEIARKVGDHLYPDRF